AASGGHYEIVKSLLDTKARPEISLQDIFGQTALHIATLGGHYEIARLLRERDINIELRTISGQTAADIAASTGHTEIARLILESEVGTVATYDNKTELHLAAQMGHESIVRLLLEKGADVDMADGGGWHPLFGAVMFGHEAMVALL
ncbi:ankyrin, partial [Morchella conica CCBAS932]